LVLELLRTEARLQQVGHFRHAYLAAPSANARLITSPLAILELIEWQAEVVTKQIIVESAGPHVMQRKGRKEIGDLIQRLSRIAADPTSDPNHARDASAAISGAALPGSFILSHSFRGVAVEGLHSFSVGTDDALGRAHDLAFLQLGTADILHVLAAQHLGCSHFGTFDSDFSRARETLASNFGLTLLTSVDEIRRLVLA